MKDRQMEGKPATVQESAKRAGDIYGRWPWVEPGVWTERMLTALEKGVKGGKWYSLMDKVRTSGNLQSAFEGVKANSGGPGVDHVTIKMFEEQLEENLKRLSEQLRKGEYRPQAIKRVLIPKPGTTETRPLGIPTVRDRVVQAAMRSVMEPIFEIDFADRSYGFRPGRGCKDALRQVNQLLNQGYTYVVDADLKSYFDTIPHDMLMSLIQEKVADNSFLAVVEYFLKQRVMDTAAEWTPEAGTPQGAVLSPLLSNIYLNPLDHKMAEAGMEMVRYADDFVLLFKTEADARKGLEIVAEWTGAAGLTLHPVKTRIVDATQRGGFDFLGYHFERGMKWPRKKSLKKMQDSIRGKTRRCNGNSISEIIEDINLTLIGWFAYFKHSHRTTFPVLDSWIRMRLRSILRKRHGGRGRGRGSDHQQWPNAYFAKHGLFFLTTAHAKACQSVQR